MFTKYSKKLSYSKEIGNFRSIFPMKKEGAHIFLEGKKYLNLSSNDYLGLASNPEIAEGFMKQSGAARLFGAASSRLLTGNSDIYFELENYIAKIYQKQKCLIFNSGYHANLGIISALADKKDLILSDKLNHASIIDGIILSGSDFKRFPHTNYEALEKKLIKYRENYENVFIITESLFSMDGDIADLKKLTELKRRYNCILIVDEAHAFGVMGENGLGVCEEQNVIPEIDVIIATFGKAAGSIGAFCVCNDILADYLVNHCRTLIFSTALPEINTAFTLYVLKEIFPKCGELRKKLLTTAQLFHQELEKFNLPSIGGSWIVPVITGSNQTAIKFADILKAHGVYSPAIRPPTVPENGSRLRISLRADVDFEQISGIAEILQK